MKPGLIPLFVVLTGCGIPHPAVTTTEPSWPSLCAGEPDAHTSHDPPEAPDCWRAHFPVRPCDAPVHPELIGLWGLGGSRFEGRLIYDGCCVTFYDTGLRRMTPTLDMASELATYGRPANVGAANRTQAEWDGDTLSSDSHLGTNRGRPSCARRRPTRRRPPGRRHGRPDVPRRPTFRAGGATTRSIPAARLHRRADPRPSLRTIDRPGRDTGAYGRRRVPGVVGLVTRWHEHDAVLVSTPPRSFTFSIASGALARARPQAAERRRDADPPSVAGTARPLPA